MDQDRGDLRHIGRRHERGGAGGRMVEADGARAALDTYWRRVSHAAAFSPLQRSPLERLTGRWTLDTSPAYLAIELMSRVFSPYDLNPTGASTRFGRYWPKASILRAL
jgi:hypothetical protein